MGKVGAGCLGEALAVSWVVRLDEDELVADAEEDVAHAGPLRINEVGLRDRLITEVLLTNNSVIPPTSCKARKGL